MKTGEIIKLVLREKGLKQSWLAKKIGVSPSLMSIILSNDIKFERLQLICKTLNITFQDIQEMQKKDSGNPTKNQPESSQTEI